MKILLVEDDATLSMGMEYSLVGEGYHVDIGGSFEAGKDLFDGNDYDLVILDVGLPDGNGFDLCRHIRKTSKLPVIFLTAEDEEVSIVMGLDIGADDYITKPFRIRELLSRIRAILRRTNSKSGEGVLRSKDIEMNLLENRVYKAGREIYLTPSEYKLLQILMQNSKQTLTRQVMLEKLWDVEGDFIDDNSLSVYIKRLREKIEEDSSSPEYIRTIRGVGYTWDVRG